MASFMTAVASTDGEAAVVGVVTEDTVHGRQLVLVGGSAGVDAAGEGVTDA